MRARVNMVTRELGWTHDEREEDDSKKSKNAGCQLDLGDVAARAGLCGMNATERISNHRWLLQEEKYPGKSQKVLLLSLFPSGVPNAA